MDSDGASDADNAVPAQVFRCNQCVKLIVVQDPVYMLKDRSYCSPECRSRGRSTFYWLRHASSHSTRSFSKSSWTSGKKTTASSETDSMTDAREKKPLARVIGEVVKAFISNIRSLDTERSVSEIAEEVFPEFCRMASFISPPSFRSPTNSQSLPG
mmetsp:Transcript_17293/g.46882  ORF Transcript_17293/g.46882 Transcript_17293/m.46882 type:complete len:156 (-) Transcript_17293:333-800(-)